MIDEDIERPDADRQSPGDTTSDLPDFPYPPYITLAHMFDAPKGWSIRNRTMGQYVLQYVVEGRADYPVGGHAYPTVKGDLLFHRPGEPHSILTLEGEPYVCLSFVFHFGESEFPVRRLFGDAHLLGNYAGTELEKKLNRLVHLYRQPGLSSQLQAQGLLLEVLGEAAAGLNTTRDDSAVEARTKAKLLLLQNYIREHFAENVQHGDLERIAGLSRNYIIVQFRRQFGLTPMQYLTWVRIQKARELALQTNLSVSEIAGQVGYADVHTFGKMFKKKTGTSLSQFCSALVSPTDRDILDESRRGKGSGRR
ncbi:AraC family transcriptional regulator [Cohnella ginsengisoli]|uniref:AraC family transcriptional regulator n=1 Tax=Cohnella ginsengisoli TaxID=425004 RepID=A0A9X4KMZ4_9BACL|nr:AraC family transcriptional regulator [Cohnella ginsengisoli]MDG0795113.1 AraC family transcriptional regulator [Cohnella ginsengisoli]